MTSNVFLHIESHACEYHLHELFMNDARSGCRLASTTLWHAPQKEPSAHWNSSSNVCDMSEKAQKIEIYYTGDRQSCSNWPNTGFHLVIGQRW